MTDMFSDTYWQEEFDITTDDLNRITKRMREGQTAFTLTELAQRLVRGRLEHGEDTSTAALPEWVQEQKVLSWDAEGQWEIGNRVLVARTIEKKVIKPFIGVIVDKKTNIFLIRLEEGGEILKYARTKNTMQAKHRFETIRNAITEKERTAQKKQLRREADEYVEIIMIEHGARIASRLSTALENDIRFVYLEDRWFLDELLQPLSQNQLNKLHQKMLAQGKPISLTEMQPLVNPPLQPGDVGLFSLENALEEDLSGIFKKLIVDTQPRWHAIKPQPPPWDRAVAAYYVYDPNNYEIILQPDQPLKKHIAERLYELGMYDEVVTPRAS